MLITHPFNFNPDDHIYSVNPYERAKYPAGRNDVTINDIASLPNFEYILFVSIDAPVHQQWLQEKLCPTGLAIVINDCIAPHGSWKKMQTSDLSELNPDTILESLVAYQKIVLR